jgi:hypothetical protein
VSVRQREEENTNVSLMHVGLIAGTPIRPKFAFSVDVLDVFYHLRRRQPSLGVQGFVKAICAFQQVCNPLLSPLQTKIRPVQVCQLHRAAFFACIRCLLRGAAQATNEG